MLKRPLSWIGARLAMAALLTASVVGVGWGQGSGGNVYGQSGTESAGAAAPGSQYAPAETAPASNAGGVAGSGSSSRASAAPVSSGGATPSMRSTKLIELPNDAGQVWKEYDLTPYTSRVTDSEKPEQAVVDWILRETGTEAWFSDPLGILSASRSKLRVYHTPEMQEIVRDIYYRFVNSQAESHVFNMRLVTIDSPNWRTLAFSLMQPVTVQSPGVEAWLLSKENYALLASNLARRTDYREHSSPNILIHNGQGHSLSRFKPKSYMRSAGGQGGIPIAPQIELGQIQEGFSLQISPLMSLDGRTIDAVVKCEIDQVERLVPINVDLANPLGPPQRVQIQVPQLVSWRLHERFRWPADQVLLLSCGVVATPDDEPNGPLGIPKLLPSNPLTNTVAGRADALLFIESKGKASQALLEAQRRAADVAPNYRGRY